MMRYDSSAGSSYPLWDRVVSHSIRPEGRDGFLLPYHDYLEPTGDPDEDERRQALASEITRRPSRHNVPFVPRATRPRRHRRGPVGGAIRARPHPRPAPW